MTTLLTRRRFSVDDYHRMAGAGIFADADRVELILGEIVEMTPIGSRHAGTVNYLVRALSAGLGDRAIVAAQNPVQIGGLDSEPQPDVTVLRPRADFYRDSHPEPGHVLLAIEVADRSAETDRRVKVPLYARAGILEVWLVDLAAGRVETHRDPAPEGYRTRRVHGRGETAAAAAFPDLALPVDAVLG